MIVIKGSVFIQRNDHLNKKLNSYFVHFLWEQHLVSETATLLEVLNFIRYIYQIM